MSTSAADELEPTPVAAESVPAPRAEGVSEGQGRTVSGKTSIADAVVAKIAGVSAAEVPGVHALGGGAARAFGALRDRIPGTSSPSATQGVSIDVDDRHTTIELDVVVDYGVVIPELADAIRKNVIRSVETMTGFRVMEVNIAVADVHLPDDIDETIPASDAE
ncbi:Asp23/Gls24 family envelope stress response protein [Cryptosporangium sp. NPDC048952]|uniref:Asp23/Gls24 family envelope stress response protein n=1 Tax=Cryptosporangium sp. NPDC048952 TaxID=3363961 RepID=UPI0037144050